MASLALLNSKPHYAYTMLGYGKDIGPVAFKSNHKTRPRAYRCGHSFHPTRWHGSSNIVNSLTDDIFQTVIIAFIILSDPALKAVYDKFGILELVPFLKSLGMDCQVSLMAFCRGVWFCCFENEQNLQGTESKSLLDINNYAQCALSKLTSTSMNTNSVKKSYSEQNLADDKSMMDFYNDLNAAHAAASTANTTFGHHPYPAEFVMIPSLFGRTALYNARLHADPFSTLNFEDDENSSMFFNPFKRSIPMSDDDDEEEEEEDDDNVGDNDIFMRHEPSAKRFKN